MTQTQIKKINTIGAISCLVVGLIIAVLLLTNRPEVEKVERVASGELVTAIEATATHTAPRITAQGTVIPARKITLRPQVSGVVVERHPELLSGGVVHAGDVLLSIDPRDYEISVAEARNGVERARAGLKMEEGRQVVARQEWERFGTKGEAAPPLALREPQLHQSELELRRAEQRLARARLDLERTRLKAPFTALVTTAAIEPGELVTSSNVVATLVALDEFWVQVSVPADTLGLLALPGRDGELGSRAIIRHQSGERVIEHYGRIIRLMGDLDPAGRMARVLVRVRDPYALTAPTAVAGDDAGDDDAGAAAGDDDAARTPGLRDVPLMLGSYVSVEFEGANPRDVVVLPRLAIHDGQYVYVARPDDTLEIRPVRFAWRNRDTVAVAEGIEPGERIIITGLAAPIDGVPLRVEIAPSPVEPAPPFPPEPDLAPSGEPATDPTSEPASESTGESTVEPDSEPAGTDGTDATDDTGATADTEDDAGEIADEAAAADTDGTSDTSTSGSTAPDATASDVQKPAGAPAPPSNPKPSDPKPSEPASSDATPAGQSAEPGEPGEEVRP